MAVPIGKRRVAKSYLLISVLFITLKSIRCDNIAAGASTSDPEAPHRRFEYKYSFKGPHLSLTDGSIPFWIHSGNAIPSADQVRITPSLRSQKGSVWTKNMVLFESWEAVVTFRVSGRGRMGADGLGIWFTSQQGLDGPVYGAADKWNGIGIFFDSFDNDGKKNNPAIVVVGNNGKLVYDHQNDGTTQALGTCLRDFRNKPYPIRAKITYYQKSLTVMINNGFTPDKDDYEFCTKMDGIVIPKEGFFGISAATGGLADDHDVLSFLLFRLTEPGQQKPPAEAEIPKEEKDKYQEEFENFQQELDKKKEEFQKEHPDVQGEPIEEQYESVNDREIRQVFEGQNRIHLEIKQLHRQLAMILDEQRRYVSVITDEVAKKGMNAESGQPDAGSLQMSSVIATQQEVLKNLNDLRMERDADFLHKKAERATLRVCLRDKYRLPKSEQDDNMIEMAGDDVDVPEELLKMVDEDATEEEVKDSFLGQMQNLQNMDMDQLKEKASTTVTELKTKAEEKCSVM